LSRAPPSAAGEPAPAVERGRQVQENLMNEVRIRLFGTRGSAEAHAIRDFLYRSGVPFQWVELSSDVQARPSCIAT
jgi:hypothetical protein